MIKIIIIAIIAAAILYFLYNHFYSESDDSEVIESFSEGKETFKDYGEYVRKKLNRMNESFTNKFQKLNRPIAIR